MDFRGRCYPLSPHLNHMGADMSRGLLEYGDGKPLGKDGFYWLLIHFANCMGKDKLTFPERIQYAEEMTDVAIKCAKDPYLHIDWMKAEDPWQALAAMFEISDALAVRNYIYIYIYIYRVKIRRSLYHIYTYIWMALSTECSTIQP